MKSNVLIVHIHLYKAVVFLSKQTSMYDRDRVRLMSSEGLWVISRQMFKPHIRPPRRKMLFNSQSYISCFFLYIARSERPFYDACWTGASDKNEKGISRFDEETGIHAIVVQVVWCYSFICPNPSRGRILWVYWIFFVNYGFHHQYLRFTEFWSLIALPCGDHI